MLKLVPGDAFESTSRVTGPSTVNRNGYWTVTIDALAFAAPIEIVAFESTVTVAAAYSDNYPDFR